MKQHGDVIYFSQSEFGLCDLGSIPVNEVSTVAAELYKQSDALYQTAFSIPGDMATFNKATEMRLLAEKLEHHAPELNDENVTRLFKDLETLLGETL